MNKNRFSRNKRKIGNTTADISPFIKMDSEANKIFSSSRQLDEFEYTSDIIQPPQEPKELIALIERNDSLKQNIEAIATNIAEFGYGIKYNDEFDYNKADKSVRNIADSEWELLRKLYKYINPLTNFNSIIHDLVVDMYSIGWGMIEIIRNGTGHVCSIEYCRACNFRLAKNTNALAPIKIWEETDTGYEQIESQVKFKKFVQVANGKKVYFKEFGDLRIMNYKTGNYTDETPEEERATEIAYFQIHSSYTDYGVPNWINVAIPASGNVLSELLNYKYFSEGRILPMAVTVSGGQLTEESEEAIRKGKGIENAYKILILEASPFEDSEEEKFLAKGADPRVGIDVKSLTDTNNTDSLFRNYQIDGKNKIRDSFRLPPIYTGASTDYNRATADTARQIAEEQIFIPERKRICDILNKIINNEFGIRYCELYLRGPEISDAIQKATVIDALNRAGAVTPNMLLETVGDILGKDYEPWNEELGDMPFELVKIKLQTANNQSDDNNIKKSDESLKEIDRLIDIIEAEIGEDAHD